MYDLNTGTSLHSRLVSAFMLSLPTSFALESIFPARQPTYDPERKIPQMVDITQYQQLWINLYTLFRNMAGVVNKDVFVRLDETQIALALLSEMEVIDSLLMNEGQDVCKAHYYMCSYDDLYRGQVSKYVKTRSDNTQSQKVMKAKFLVTMQILRKRFEFPIYNDSLEVEDYKKALILTHIPYDLTSHMNFKQLDLIESHTGVLKPKHLWWTKYYKVPDEQLNILPFTKKLLLVFGDNVLISPMDIKIRRIVLETARRHQWNQMTTDTKIMYDLNSSIKEPMVLEAIRSFK